MPNHVDDIFRSALENHHEVADASVWDKLGQTLSSKEGKVVLPWYYNPKKALFVALFISMMSFGGGYIYALLNDGSDIVTVDQGISKAQLAVLPEVNEKSNKQASLQKVADDLTKDAAIQMDKPLQVATLDNAYAILAGNSASGTSLDRIGDRASSESDANLVGVIGVVATTVLQSVTKDVKSPLELGDEMAEDEFFLDALMPNEIEQGKATKSEVLKTSIETPVSYGKFASRFMEFSTGKNTLTPSFSMDDVTVDFSRSEYITGSNSNYTLRFGKYISPNIGVFSGVRIDRFGLTRNREELRASFPEPNSGEFEDPYGVVVKSNYNYEFTSFEIPIGVRLKGLYHRLGYHTDFGVSYTKGITQGYSFELNEDFSNLNQDLTEEEYDMSSGALAFTRVGLDYYLFTNGGLSFDAVLRKRLTATSGMSQLNGQGASIGAQIGIFCIF